MQFKIENMSCAGCARSVTATVQGIDANAVLEIDVATKIVNIESKQLDVILTALQEDGFPAQAL